MGIALSEPDVAVVPGAVALVTIAAPRDPTAVRPAPPATPRFATAVRGTQPLAILVSVASSDAPR